MPYTMSGYNTDIYYLKLADLIVANTAKAETVGLLMPIMSHILLYIMFCW